ncbi:MAG: hypothetical protein MZU95_05910 [Desulfomicrobium escambiense]|nr:hypothetical protein [Desulfomicrobium escambiense]
MPRNIPVGNDSLLITFDEDYCIRDIYFPCVGKENHTVGHRFRTGLWVEGQFSWIDRSWNLNLEYARREHHEPRQCRQRASRCDPSLQRPCRLPRKHLHQKNHDQESRRPEARIPPLFSTTSTSPSRRRGTRLTTTRTSGRSYTTRGTAIS